jgi:uncharacterized protein YggE
MRKIVICFAAALFSLFVPCSRASAQCAQNCPERRTISVTAAGSATADADVAIVRVGYKIYGPDAKSADASASETSHAIMQALNASGIPKASIESSSQALQHTQPFELQQVPMGAEERLRRQFTVAQSWAIRVKPDDASKALDTAINAGANESGWIQWIVQNPNQLEAQASAKALVDARTIAEQMAQKSDVHLGHLVSANENQHDGIMGDPINGAIGGIGSGFGNSMGMGMAHKRSPSIPDALSSMSPSMLFSPLNKRRPEGCSRLARRSNGTTH